MLRAVTHLDVSLQDAERAADIIRAEGVARKAKTGRGSRKTAAKSTGSSPGH